MATNKKENQPTEAATENTAMDAETPANDTGGTERPVNVRYEGVTTFAYVGPSLLGARLKSNTVINGTFSEVTEYYKDALGEYPDVAKLIIPVSRLADMKQKVETPGNIYHKYYNDLVSAFKAKSEEE